jgi:hypothetical protein
MEASGRGEAISLKEGGTPLGILPGKEYADTQVQLEAGDRLVLYTDGLTEAMNAEEEEFGEPRLVGLGRTNSGLGAAELLEVIRKEVSGYQRGKFSRRFHVGGGREGIGRRSVSWVMVPGLVLSRSGAGETVQGRYPVAVPHAFEFSVSRFSRTISSTNSDCLMDCRGTSSFLFRVHLMKFFHYSNLFAIRTHSLR